MLAVPYRDIERRRAYGREWMRRNREKAREAMRRCRARHSDQHKRSRDAYDSAHPIAAAQRRKRYRDRHPEVRRVIAVARRAREMQAEGKYTAREWTLLVRQHGDACAYCGATGPLQPDHRVPLSRGGSNHITNILPACGPCNRRKHVMTEAEFGARLAREKRLRPPDPGAAPPPA